MSPVIRWMSAPVKIVCRFCHPATVTVLGILSRAVQGEARVWIALETRARDRICPTLLAEMSRHLGHVINLIVTVRWPHYAVRGEG